MMIGPEPMSRMDERSVRLGIEKILERPIERNRRRPSSRRMELRRVAHEVENIGPPPERRIVFGDPPPAGQLLEPLEHVAEREPFPRRDVVGLAHHPALEE